MDVITTVKGWMPPVLLELPLDTFTSGLLVKISILSLGLVILAMLDAA